MGEKIAQFNLQVGEYVTVSYDIDAHEYQGRWFNAVRAWNVVRANQATQQPPQQQAYPQQYYLNFKKIHNCSPKEYFKKQ